MDFGAAVSVAPSSMARWVKTDDTGPEFAEKKLEVTMSETKAAIASHHVAEVIGALCAI